MNTTSAWKTGPVRVGLWIVLCLAFAVVHAGDAGVRAYLDRDTVTYGDSVTLNVEMDDATSFKTPDVHALKKDFEILGTSRNSNIRIINGKRQAKSVWALQLRPRHVGRIHIPALSVGGHSTAPLTLDVTEAASTQRGGPGDEVFVEASVDTQSPYVGQQVALTVRLFYTPAIQRGGLDMPDDDAVEITQMGDGTRYQNRRDGHLYNVLERHYALVAKHAGPINLAPVAFRGVMRGGRGAGGFFGGMQRVSALSEAIRLVVRAKPDAAGKGRWLPARGLKLTLQGLPDDGTLEVGQPLTLTLTEKAQGLAFESLPEPELPPLEGADVYPDPAQGDTKDTGRWFEATRTRTFSVVPRQPGTLTLPAISLAWWNVQKDRLETAHLPAHTLEVHPAAVPDATPAAPAGTATTASAMSTGPAPDTARGRRWPWPTVLALVLWLSTMLVAAGFWWRRRRARAGRPGEPVAAGGVESVSVKQRRRAFLRAARQGGVELQAETLLAWARSLRPPLRNLDDLASALSSGRQRQAIADLQRARYGTGEAPPGALLVDALGKGFKWADARHGPDKDTDTLPPLYP